MDGLLADNLEGLNRVKVIVSNLKDFARLDTGHGSSEADLEENIRKTLTMANNGIKYCAEVNVRFGNIPKVNCNIFEINQVFLNIIVNSAHAIGEQKKKRMGRITILTREDETSVYCEISDNGPGIPSDILPRIFDPFFTTKPIGKGTGLGLSIAYDIIVNKHKGDIHAISVPGEGTTFVIKLPKCKQAGH
jgi:signal transduction histidine kinase